MLRSSRSKGASNGSGISTYRPKRTSLVGIIGIVILGTASGVGSKQVNVSADGVRTYDISGDWQQAEGFDEPVQDRRRVSLNWVSPNYFATYATPLLEGRDFRDADSEEPRRVIVNQALARRYFAGRNPIGLHVWLENERDPYEIVGVAGDAKYQDIKLAAPPTVYLFAQMSRGSTTLSLRTDVNPITVAADARQIVTEMLGADSVRRVTTLANQVDAAVVPERLMALLGGFFGAVGALLAAIGLYGLLAYTVARRTKEIGIRMARSARRAATSRG